MGAVHCLCVLREHQRHEYKLAVLGVHKMLWMLV